MIQNLAAIYFPFTYSLKKAVLDRAGPSLTPFLTQNTLEKLDNYFIVDTSGLLIWSLTILAIGLYVGRNLPKFRSRISLGTNVFTENVAIREVVSFKYLFNRIKRVRARARS
jgi:hypothetical protein